MHLHNGAPVVLFLPRSEFYFPFTASSFVYLSVSVPLSDWRCFCLPFFLVFTFISISPSMNSGSLHMSSYIEYSMYFQSPYPSSLIILFYFFMCILTSTKVLLLVWFVSHSVCLIVSQKNLLYLVFFILSNLCPSLWLSFPSPKSNFHPHSHLVLRPHSKIHSLFYLFFPRPSLAPQAPSKRGNCSSLKRLGLT